MERLKLGNGKWETAKYNERLQVTQIGLGSSATDTSLLKLEFDYGNNTQNNGSMRSQKISFNGLSQPFEQTYAYDDLNRLQSATETVNKGATTTWKQTFQYDRFGNRRFDAANTTNLSQSSPTKVTNPLINTSDNRLKKDQDNDTITDYEYDKTGNLTQDSEGKTFLYDAENHQKEVLINGVSKGKYLYDGEGKRVKKISDLETTIFVYNGGGQLVAEYSTQQSATPQVSYLTQDHLGSPRIITDNTGKVIARKDFNAFGDETNSAQRTEPLGYKPEEVRQDYTGYQKDDESGLEFAQARYYNTKHGRFTSVDPMTASANVKDPQTFNRYSYAMNSPYKFTYPLGLVATGVGQGSSSGSDVGHSHMSNPKGMSLDFPFEAEYSVEVTATVTSPSSTANQAHEAAHAAAQGDDSIDASAITPTASEVSSTPTTTGGTADSETRRVGVLLLVGESGLGAINVGSNFLRAARTRAAELEAAGISAWIWTVSTVEGFNDALSVAASEMVAKQNNADIVGVEIFAHGKKEEINFGEGKAKNTNFTINDVSNMNTGFKGYIRINACNTGNGTYNIASKISSKMGIAVYAPTTGMSFSSKPDRIMGNVHLSTGPTYMIPEGGVWQTFKP
jgi:RHS repeat-associated protein